MDRIQKEKHEHRVRGHLEGYKQERTKGKLEGLTYEYRGWKEYQLKREQEKEKERRGIQQKMTDIEGQVNSSILRERKGDGKRVR